MRVLRNQRGQGPRNQKVVFTTFWWYKYHLACSTKNPEIQGVSRQNFIGRPVAGMKYMIGEVGFQREQQAEEILGVFARFSLRILTICHFGARTLPHQAPTTVNQADAGRLGNQS